MNIQAIFVGTILVLACITFGLYFVGRFAPARGCGKRYWGKRKRALVRARELVGQMRQFAHSPRPERWRQVDLVARLVIRQAELGKFPLHEAGTSAQEIQKLKLLVADKAEKKAEVASAAPKPEPIMVIPSRETCIELEAAPPDEKLDLDRTPVIATDDGRWRENLPAHTVTFDLPERMPNIQLAAVERRAPDALPHEWRESHEESLLANFDNLFGKAFKL